MVQNIKTRNFLAKKKLAFSLILSGFTSLLPQHCLYFLPLPHDYALLVYIVHIVLSLLLLFQIKSGLVIFGIYVIYSIIVTMNIS